MASEVEYPAVPLEGREGTVTGQVTVDPRTGATTAVVGGRSFTSQPKAGQRRALDDSFLAIRKVLRRGGYRLRTCGVCQHFRYSAASRGLSAGLSGYCGLGHREPGLASIGPTGPAATPLPVVTLYFGCPAWEGREERASGEFFARPHA